MLSEQSPDVKVTTGADAPTSFINIKILLVEPSHTEPLISTTILAHTTGEDVYMEVPVSSENVIKHQAEIIASSEQVDD